MLEFTIQQIAEISSRHAAALTKKAAGDRWPYREAERKGRYATRLYPFAGLPVQVQEELATKSDTDFILKLAASATKSQPLPDSVQVIIAQRLGEQRPGPVIVADPTPAPAPVESLRELDKERLQMALDRAKWLRWFRAQKQKRLRLYEIRVALEVARDRDGSTPALSTLQLWDKKDREDGAKGLMDRRVGRSGRKAEVERLGLADLIISLKVHNYSYRPKRLIEIVEYHTGHRLGEKAMRSWLADQEERANKLLFAHLKDPDAAKRLLPYPGEAHGWRQRNRKFLDMIEWDGTTIDVMTVDGQRWTVLAAIDVATRQVGMIMAKKTSATAAKELLRLITQTWGVPHAIRTDQGSEFLNREVEWALVNLGVTIMPAMPFSGEQKPFIERFFGTLERGLAEQLPGYVGHNVAERQAIRSRKNYSARAALDKGPQTERDQKYFRVQLTPQELFERIEQFSEVYHNTPHGGLKGETPNQALERLLPQSKVVRPEGKELDLLLAEKRFGLSVRVDGIHLKVGVIEQESRIYSAPEYADYIGRKVAVAFTADATEVHVFDNQDGKYLFTAWDKAASPKWAQERREQIKEEILTQQAGYLERLTEQIGEEEPYYAVLEAKAAVGAEVSKGLRQRISDQAITQSNTQLAKAVADRPQASAAPRLVQAEPEADGNRYLTAYLELQDKVQAGVPLSEDEQSFMSRLEQFPAVRDYIQGAL